MRAKLMGIYSELMEMYGPQGWWPLLDCKGTNPAKTGAVKGYHPKDYSYPRNKAEEFEICVGAILTQNTAWTNVEKTLSNLKKEDALAPEKIIRLPGEKLRNAIKPSGYYNQKAKKLTLFSHFYLSLRGKPSREQLLSVWGIGKETADSMLLYAFNLPVFVVDAYTRRIFSNLGYSKQDADYDEIKSMFEDSIPPDIVIYQEYHALIVEHAKQYYSGKKESYDCPLKARFSVQK